MDVEFASIALLVELTSIALLRSVKRMNRILIGWISFKLMLKLNRVIDRQNFSIINLGLYSKHRT